MLQQNGAGKEGGVLVPRADPRGGVPVGIQEWGSQAEDCGFGNAGHALPLQHDPHAPRHVMAMLNLGSKKPYTAAILMELVFLLHTHGCSLAANHVPREFNQWADELTHPDAFDLSVGPPMLP